MLVQWPSNFWNLLILNILLVTTQRTNAHVDRWLDLQNMWLSLMIFLNITGHFGLIDFKSIEERTFTITDLCLFIIQQEARWWALPRLLYRNCCTLPQNRIRVNDHWQLLYASELGYLFYINKCICFIQFHWDNVMNFFCIKDLL
jgi:hypothetical protein